MRTVHGPGATSQTSSLSSALMQLLLPAFTSPPMTRSAAAWRFVRRARRIWVASLSAHRSASHNARWSKLRRVSNCCFSSGLRIRADKSRLSVPGSDCNCSSWLMRGADHIAPVSRCPQISLSSCRRNIGFLACAPSSPVHLFFLSSGQQRTKRPLGPQAESLCSFCRCRIDDLFHLGNPVGRESTLLRVLAHQLFIRRDVNAVSFVIRHVALDPLDLRSEFFQDSVRFLPDRVQLLLQQFPRLRNLPFNYIFRHRFPPPIWSLVTRHWSLLQHRLMKLIPIVEVIQVHRILGR